MTEDQDSKRKPLTLASLAAMKAAGEPIVMLTAYDAAFAACLEAVGVDSVLVGDSLGMVLQGRTTTLGVTLDDMVYHTRCVRRGLESPWLVADMPFMSCATMDRALDGARRLMGEGGAAMVKLEGAGEVVEITAKLTALGVPVCGHLGLTPQSVLQLGGYHVQARDSDDADRLMVDAVALEEAGAGLLVLECIPAALARQVSERLTIPTIGIGAGAHCDGQVLVLHDLLGIPPGRKPSFSRDFLSGAGSVVEAVSRYARAVRDGRFPGSGESFD